MLARDIMSSPVISVTPSRPVTEIAALLRDHRIGGMPVVEDGALVGMVTESDLIHRHEIGTDQIRDFRPWWRRLGQRHSPVLAYVKSHGRTARHVMANRVRVVEHTADLAHVATVLDFHRISRVPVVEGDRLVGIIARADLVKALATHPLSALGPEETDDETIHQRLVAELSRQSWWNGCWENVYVSAGVVIFKGVVESDAHRMGARVAAENLPGVRSVQDDRVLAVNVSGMV